jgi:hypothetical protein
MGYTGNFNTVKKPWVFIRIQKSYLTNNSMKGGDKYAQRR